MHVSVQDKKEPGHPYLVLWYFSILNLAMFILSAPFWGQVLWARVTVLFLCSPEACGVGVSWTMDSPFLLLLCASLLAGHSTGLRCSCPLKNLFSKVLVTFNSCWQPLSLQTNSFCLVLRSATWLNCVQETGIQNESAQK